MNFFSLLGPWDGDAFAAEIALEFSRNCPPAAAAESGKEAAKRLARSIDVLRNRAAKFQRERSLGWIRKARLLRAVQAKLREAGYDEGTINDALYAMAVKQ